MLWMTLVSFRRNLRKYSLSMIGLSLAVLVSCLGISGLSILQQSTLQPLRFIGGENVIIADARTTLMTSSKMVYADPLEVKPFSADIVEEMLQEIAPGSNTISTLIAPYFYNDRIWVYVGGRSEPEYVLSSYLFDNNEDFKNDQEMTGIWMPAASYQANEGTEQVSWTNQIVGDKVQIKIPRIEEYANLYDWSIPDSVTKEYQIQGLFDYKKTLYFLDWVELSELQNQVGGNNAVSWIGIESSVENMDGLKEQLVKYIKEAGLPLQVWTIYDLGRLLIGDFDRFEKMAGYYVPVMLFVALLIVLVNSIALTLARRKELALLRIVGFSLTQIQAMFIVECIIIAIIGGLIGTSIATMFSLGFAKNLSVSWLPFFISVGATVIVSTVTTILLTKGKLANTLRNPAE